MRHLLTVALLALPAIAMAQTEVADSSFQIAHVRTMQEVLVRAWSDTKKKRREWIDSKSTVETTLTIRPTARTATPDVLLDIYPTKHVEIVNSKSRKYKMQQRLGAVPREYRLVK